MDGTTPYLRWGTMPVIVAAVIVALAGAGLGRRRRDAQCET
jgi:apolipoprotein N-acyltransferase